MASKSARRCGSSPLARGLRAPPTFGWEGRRIIPARAGFTVGCGGCWSWWADHPRSRGVYHASSGCHHRPSGSSPLARGLHKSSDGKIFGIRIIPARAGFTSRPGSVLVSTTDHPRSRGVYDGLRCPVHVLRGSSPLARGLLRAVMSLKPAQGIIPARAGFTSSSTPIERRPRWIIPARAGFTSPAW